MTFDDRKYKLGRFRLDALTRAELIDIFANAVSSRSQLLILHQNLHNLYIQLADKTLNALYDAADYVYVDGMPVVWLARAAGLPFGAAHRITFLDCFEEVLAVASDKAWRVFYFGGREDVLRDGLTTIRKLFPLLTISGHHGYGTDEQNRVVPETIKAFRPDILFVGLGMPLQERWIAQHRSLLRAPVITTCGATMEYISGHASRPPLWAGKLGLYGIARLLSSPGRFWRRYLVEPLVLAPFLAIELLRHRLHRHNTYTYLD